MKDYAQRATARLKTTAGWFEDLSPAQKKEYIKTHPNSKYAKGPKKGVNKVKEGKGAPPSWMNAGKKKKRKNPRQGRTS